MEIKFKNIYIENFCGIKKLDTPLYDRTLISGQNGVGKSTIRSAIFWVLANRLSASSATDGIRPHDENGVDIDFIDITVVLTLEVDGKEIELKKVQKQQWTKPRGKSEKRFDGNRNFYSINGIDKDEKPYQKYIDEKIAPIEQLILCTNASYLLALDAKKRRQKLIALESDFSESKVVESDEKFKPFAEMLEDGTVEELIARSKKQIKKANDKMKEISTRIDELEKQKEDIDVAELELLKNSLKEQIADNEKKQTDLSKQFEEQQKLSDGVFDLKFKLNGLQQEANANLDKKRSEIRTQIDDAERQLNSVSENIRSANQKIEWKENIITSNTEQIENFRNKWTGLNRKLNAEKEREFDENSLICSYCGQEYPEEKQEHLRKEFESHKANAIKIIQGEMSAITGQGNTIKSVIEKDKAEIEQLKATMQENKDEQTNLTESIKGLESSLEDIPQSVDISDREDVKEIQRQITEKESAMNKSNSAEELRQMLKFEESDLNEKLINVEREIAKADTTKIDNSIEKLEAEFEQAKNSASDEEKMLDLLESFNRAKVELLTDSINANFDLVKWQMFKPQINGGYAECCEPTVGGSSYYKLLNDGNRILAESDICLAFQKINGISCPIILDRTESVDDWLIPKTEGQLIMLEHDRKVDKLTVTEG